MPLCFTGLSSSTLTRCALAQVSWRMPVTIHEIFVFGLLLRIENALFAISLTTFACTKSSLPDSSMTVS